MYKLKHNAFPAEYLEQLETALLDSPYLGDSPLGDEFVSTLGFSIVFRRSRLDEVLARFSYLSTYLETVVFESSNAFYINPVVMNAKPGETSRVEPHVDCRFLEPQNVRIVPNLVSVLYVRGASEGGELCFHPGTAEEKRLRPQTNDLLHFVGDLVHSVSEVPPSAPVRISLVCEQYNLTAPALAAFPEFAVLQTHDLAPRVPAT